MRIREAAEARENDHRIKITKKYLEDHDKMVKKQVMDYKKKAINKALIEMYCEN